jgi:hypothetical protein
MGAAMLTVNVGASAHVKPVVTFYRFIPECRPPMRADRSAGGTLPTRAFRYCEPVASASGFGWYLFPPIDFTVVWDGSAVTWTYAGANDWYALTSAQFPGFKKYFGETAPTGIAPFAPAFLTFDPHLNMLQIWSGYVAQTKEDWSLLVRPVVNVSRTEQFCGFDAIIETDHWFGPLFTNIKFLKPDIPIHFRTDFPFLQLQPLPREVYSDATLNDFKVVPNLAMLSEQDWAHYHETVIKPNSQRPRTLGRYAVAVRKRRKQNLVA